MPKLIDELYPGFSTRSEIGRKSRAKGVSFEREMAKRLRAVWPDAKRLFGQARDGDECPDVGGTPFWLELGKGKLALHAKMEQARSDSKTSPNPQYRDLPAVAIVHRDGAKPVVLLEVETFLELAEAWERAKQTQPARTRQAHGKKSRAGKRDP